MLCLNRRVEETVVINTSDGPITIKVIEGKARLAIDAPKEVVIVRGELLELARTAQRLGVVT